MALPGPIQPSRSARRRRLLIRCLAVACLFPPLAVLAWAQAKPSEYDVKAAYLFNFGKFLRTSAPQTQHPSFDICILGRDPIGPSLDAITANETIDHRPVRVLRLNDVHQARSCDIVFIGTFEGGAIRTDLAALVGSQVLTVSDAPDFLDRGGMIQFLNQQDHVRFAVNLTAVDRSHLALSSELLRVAASVQGKPAGVPR